MTILSASILAADFANLGKDSKAILQVGADYIHFDVMDFHFVPNLSFGAVVCKALRDDGITAPIDVHLMVEKPEKYIEPFAKAGANLICFHPETTSNVVDTLCKIQQAGMKTGLAFNPDKPVIEDVNLLKQVDMILLMSVFPGFGGQAFIDDVLEKIKQTRQLIDDNNLDCFVAVDGGVKLDNAEKIVNAGADFLVVGSGLFNADDYQQRVKAFREII